MTETTGFSAAPVVSRVLIGFRLGGGPRSRHQRLSDIPVGFVDARYVGTGAFTAVLFRTTDQTRLSKTNSGIPKRGLSSKASRSFLRKHWDHEPRTSRTVPPTRCCRRLVGRAFLRFLCRQDAGSTLRFMERGRRSFHALSGPRREVRSPSGLRSNSGQPAKDMSQKQPIKFLPSQN